ncbi:MAG TPA: TRAP transporter substrate-binding protein [Verrucomicrobiae bacterium]|nr:TRAP transporter substrate-binding protein [Verrucomicrobiae bacterium]
MIKRLIPFFALIVLLIATGCNNRVPDSQQVAKDERIVIKFSHVVAEDTPKGMAAKRFADLVRERSGGYIEVQVFPNSQLYKDGEELEALKRGDVQMLAPATSKLSAMFPEWQVLDLPYAFPDLGSVHAFLDGPVGQQLFQDLSREKFLGLAMWDNGFKQMTNNRRPLITPTDFQGLRFRVMTAKVLQEQFKALGAMGQPMAFNDVYSALANGSVDGQENTISNIYTQKFAAVQDYLTISNHGYIGYVVMTNADFWQKLHPGAKKILEDALREVTEWEREKSVELNEKQLAELKKQGSLKIHVLTKQEQQAWQQSFAPVYKQMENESSPALMRAIRQLREQGE